VRSGAGGETRGSETSQYPEEKKPKGYSLSSGERKGRSPNLPCASHKEIPITKHQIPKNWDLKIGIWDFLVRSTRWGLWGKDGGENPQGVKNPLSSRRTLERAAREGESPVGERERTPGSLTPSTTRKDNLVGSREDYLPRLNISRTPIVN
jgi:hypothetical protein